MAVDIGMGAESTRRPPSRSQRDRLEQTSPGTYQGVVALEPLHQTAWYVVATTGLGADGVRYVVATDYPVASPPWVGTVWEWLTGR